MLCLLIIQCERAGKSLSLEVWIGILHMSIPGKTVTILKFRKRKKPLTQVLKTLDEGNKFFYSSCKKVKLNYLRISN